MYKQNYSYDSLNSVEGIEFSWANPSLRNNDTIISFINYIN